MEDHPSTEGKDDGRMLRTVGMVKVDVIHFPRRMEGAYSGGSGQG